jgi:hypothetical protein
MGGGPFPTESGYPSLGETSHQQWFDQCAENALEALVLGVCEKLKAVVRLERCPQTGRAVSGHTPK